MKIKEAAELFGKPLWKKLLSRVKRVFTFEYERDNRITRFAEIIEGYKEGRMVNDLEREYGCSRGTVLRYARLANLPKRTKGFDPRVREGVITMYKLGKPIAEISAKFGVSQAYVSKAASEEGIQRRKFRATSDKRQEQTRSHS